MAKKKAATTPVDRIVIVADVGHDEQGEYSDITHCAILITREALSELKRRLDCYSANHVEFELYGIDFQMFDGLAVCFFNLDHPHRITTKIEKAMEETDEDDDGKRHGVFRGAKAVAVWDWADDTEAEVEWRVSYSSLKVYGHGEFVLESSYKTAMGGVQTPEIAFTDVETYFEGDSANDN